MEIAWPEESVCAKERIVHPVPTKGFRQPSPKAAMLHFSSVLKPACTTLSAGTACKFQEVTSQFGSCMMHKCAFCTSRVIRVEECRWLLSRSGECLPCCTVCKHACVKCLLLLLSNQIAKSVHPPLEPLS